MTCWLVDLLSFFNRWIIFLPGVIYRNKNRRKNGGGLSGDKKLILNANWAFLFCKKKKKLWPSHSLTPLSSPEPHSFSLEIAEASPFAFLSLLLLLLLLLLLFLLISFTATNGGHRWPLCSNLAESRLVEKVTWIPNWKFFLILSSGLVPFFFLFSCNTVLNCCVTEIIVAIFAFQQLGWSKNLNLFA